MNKSTESSTLWLNGKPTRLEALRDLQDFLFLEGYQLELVGKTRDIGVFDSDGNAGRVPRYIGLIIDQFEADIIETIREPTAAEKYAAVKLQRKLESQYGKPVAAGESAPDAFDEPEKPAHTPNTAF